MGLRIYRAPLVSRVLLAIVATLVLLSALYGVLVPAANQKVLIDRDWAQFAAQDPEVASIISRYLTILGLIGAAFGLLAAVIAVVPYRRGDRWAWYALWLLPVTLAAVTARQLTDQYATRNVGYLFAGLTAAAVVGLLIPIGHFLRGERS